jgi:hypothetical protein
LSGVVNNVKPLNPPAVSNVVITTLNAAVASAVHSTRTQASSVNPSALDGMNAASNGTLT